MRTLRHFLAAMAFLSIALGLVNLLMAGNDAVSRWLCGAGFIVMLTLWLYDKLKT